jgi:hypothetical protein
MTSSRQRKANRRNARRSTGPRTSAGKAAFRLNARWHGLATPLRWEPGMSQEIEYLARQITGARFELLDLARRVAEAELELRRVRQARLLLAKFPAQPAHRKMVESPNSKLFKRAVGLIVRRKKNNSLEDLSRLVYSLGWDPDAPHHILVPTRTHLPVLDPSDFFERYEKRARSRRKFAIRDFDRARLEPQQEGN